MVRLSASAAFLVMVVALCGSPVANAGCEQEIDIRCSVVALSETLKSELTIIPMQTRRLCPRGELRNYVCTRWADNPEVRGKYQYKLLSDRIPVSTAEVGFLTFLGLRNELLAAAEKQPCCEARIQVLKSMRRLLLSGAQFGFDGLQTNAQGQPTKYLLIFDPAKKLAYGLTLPGCCE